MKKIFQILLLCCVTFPCIGQCYFWPVFNPLTNTAPLPFGNAITFNLTGATGPRSYSLLNPTTYFTPDPSVPTTKPPHNTAHNVGDLGIYSIFPVGHQSTGGISFKAPTTTGFFVHISQIASSIEFSHPFILISGDGDLKVGSSMGLTGNVLDGFDMTPTTSPDDGNATIFFPETGLTGLGFRFRTKNDDGFSIAFTFPDCLTELKGLEVTQVVQDWKNSVELIEHKPTVVRAHIYSIDHIRRPFPAQLRAYSGGHELSGSPLSARNEATFTTPPKAANDQEMLDRRKDFEQSLNFEIPLSWRTGTVEFLLEGATCHEIAGVPNDCKVTKTFDKSQVMELRFINTGWIQSPSFAFHSIPPGDFIRLVRSAQRRLLAMYPISKLDVLLDPLTSGWSSYCFEGAEPYGRIYYYNNFHLKTLRGQNASRLYISILTGPKPHNPLGMARDIGAGEATVHNVSGQKPTVQHEIGHLLNQRHARYCGAKTDHPVFPSDHEIPVVPGAEVKPSISPMTHKMEEYVFGFDHQTMSVVDPFTNFELMSYCEPRWISEFTYKRLIPEIKSRFPLSARTYPSQFSSSAGQSSKALSIFRGHITISNNQISLEPVIVMYDNIDPPLPTGGAYKLQVFDAQNNIIKEVDFAPELRFVDEADEEVDEAYFIIPLLLSTSPKKIIILKNNAIVLEKIASPHMPVVKVLSPNGGENITGDSAIVKWQGSDADGDSLTYGVHASKDGGVTWQTLNLGLLDSSYTIWLHTLGASSNALIRISVSDGINVAMDESNNGFSLPNGLPHALIIRPYDGEVYIGQPPIFFEATARDIEDGELMDDAVKWYSNRNGFLGNGNNISKIASTLKEGEHIISFIATDNSGGSVTDSIKIIIHRNPPPPSIVLNCPADILRENDAGKCGASISFSASASGTPAPTLVYKIGTTIITSPHEFPVGTTTVTAIALNGVSPNTTCSFNVTVNYTHPFTVSIPDAKALSNGVALNTVYIGYTPASFITLSAQVSGTNGTLSYQWSTGATNASITVNPSVATTYTVTVTDKAGCRNTASKQIKVVDVRCGNNNDKVQVCKVSSGNPANEHVLCIASNAVAAQLATGSYLGLCQNELLTRKTTVAGKETPSDAPAKTLNATVIPNPSNQYFILNVESTITTQRILLKIRNAMGRVIETRMLNAKSKIQFGANYERGLYYAEITQGEEKLTLKLIKN